MISANERLFLIESLKNGIRQDSRKLDQLRETHIYISPEEYGYVEVSWGHTKVSVRVSAAIDKPFEDRPFEGIFSINCDISSMASQKFDNYKVGNDEVLIGRIIEKAIRRSNAVDLENLCIVAGSKVWKIQVDANFLNYDGGLIDVGSFAVMLALQHFKKPDISIEDDVVIVHDVDQRQPVPLSILHVPVCLTYSFFTPYTREQILKGDTEEIWAMDATMKEEEVRDGMLVITMNKNRELIQLSKNGGVPIDASLLVELGMKGMQEVDRLTDMMRDVLKKDEKERYERGNLKLLEVGAAR
ncbi:ribosomal protein S5 domain 2-like protein [Suhomyces tanzawaensis NRRL Y-17324]|uniref:Ribosomal protein S5 domain 2-like protein n=1 Tax=Suhomyces tanzawaensis NRRL Y-17324 TaxID=984487 RepID=A0A1E4SS32_9ASCO|nr:ribosomal protein S5 domain 2-like protein [Suhomyces tanzawaensis NRRL Y-17324]ODV82311.1 ribosomal protein S5 domain 2-like protein [Suhomyces tanzawaensis NRRL Y-17324]